MNKLELSYLADMQDEDAISIADIPLEELLKNYPKTAKKKKQNKKKDNFKSKYLEFYDDIKTSPYDDW